MHLVSLFASFPGLSLSFRPTALDNRLAIEFALKHFQLIASEATFGVSAPMLDIFVPLGGQVGGAARRAPSSGTC